MSKNLFAANFLRFISLFFIVALLITIVGITPVSAATYTVCSAGCDYASIQNAINAASAGDTITIASGTYHENINIDKQLRITGAGNTTIITQSSAGAGDSRIGVIQLSASGTSANPISIENLRIEPVSLAGISVGRFTEQTGTSVSYVRLDHVEVSGTNTSPSTEQERGLYVDRTSTLEHLEISNSAFNNLTYGWYLHKDVSVDTSNVRYVDVSDTTFNHNNHKGIYAEKLSDATFKNCTADQNGFDSSVLPWYFAPWSAGIDINLKAGNYQNITFDNCTVTNNAVDESKEGVGVTVKARDDGGTYGAHPASFTNLTIINGSYTGNERGIRIGEPGKNNASPTNVVIHNAHIYNNTQHYAGADGSVYGDVINQLGGTEWVDATDNWWGSDLGPLDITGTVEVPPCTGTPANESNTNGVGAGVNDRVDYCSWLGMPPAPPLVIFGAHTIPANGEVLSTGPTQIFIQFDQNIKNDASAGAANNINNYILAEANGDGFQTVNCATGIAPTDKTIPINIATYSSVGNFIATLNINGGTPLSTGEYRLYICGTTSIENLYNLKLNGGASDTTTEFSVTSSSGGGDDVESIPASTLLPDTGFPHGEVTRVDFGLRSAKYTSTGLELVIPKLDLTMPIVGVPQTDTGWDVTWLGDSAGYLDGTAFPTWAGNTVITGHVWDSFNRPGVFSQIKSLNYGDQVQIHAWGLVYTYEVRESKLITSKNVDAILQSEEYDWITLLTCEFYNPFNGEYLFRRTVRAVLISVK